MSAAWLVLSSMHKCFWGVGGSNSSLKTFSTQFTNITGIQDSYLPSLHTTQMQIVKFTHPINLWT